MSTYSTAQVRVIERLHDQYPHFLVTYPDDGPWDSVKPGPFVGEGPLRNVPVSAQIIDVASYGRNIDQINTDID